MKSTSLPNPALPCCGGHGPHARRDGARYDNARGVACPDCGSRARPPELSLVARVLGTLAELQRVLSLLEPEELEGQLILLERRAKLLDPRSRPTIPEV
jgi:hypothetical protein